MFERRSIPRHLEALRAEHAPQAVIVDVQIDFETLPPSQAEDLGLLVDSLDPRTYPDAWLPSDAPSLLERYAGSSFTVGMPGDGSVCWTRQTEPPVVLVKPRVRGSPDHFVDFLLAEALVEVGLDVPEHCLEWFEERYRALDGAVPLDAASTYQIAVALLTAWKGLHTRSVFAEWHGEKRVLAEAWQDAGSRLESRIDGLPSAVARGATDFADATELACSAIKHALELPAPFAALDTSAYREHGPAYAVTWAEKTFAALEE